LINEAAILALTLKLNISDSVIAKVKISTAYFPRTTKTIKGKEFDDHNYVDLDFS
jgi:hypothetical protein